jgi:predicted transcriptional regulator
MILEYITFTAEITTIKKFQPRYEIKIIVQSNILDCSNWGSLKVWIIV